MFRVSVGIVSGHYNYRRWQLSEVQQADCEYAPHKVAILAMEGMDPFSLMTPFHIFGRARLRNGRAGYQVNVCGTSKAIDGGGLTVGARWDADMLARADTVIVPGICDPTTLVPSKMVRALEAAAARGARLASLCTGTFILATAGVLDGQRATTQWYFSAELARRFPRINVEHDVVYVDNGSILTSAGAMAGLDLCVHMVRRDHGSAVATDMLRFLVMPLERAGSQDQQLKTLHVPAEVPTLAPLQLWMEENLARDLTLESIARHGAMSVRTLTRRFRDELGTTPLQWMVQARVHQAQVLLETSTRSMEEIATMVGFGATATFRDRFHRIVGRSPREYRRLFRSSRPR